MLRAGRLATSRRGGCVTERPPRPRPRTPSPRVLAHGEQAGIPGPKLLCLELGRLATTRRGGCVTERPPRPRPRTPSPRVLARRRRRRGGSRPDAGIPDPRRGRIGGRRGIAAPYPEGRVRGSCQFRRHLPSPKFAARNLKLFENLKITRRWVETLGGP